MIYILSLTPFLISLLFCFNLIFVFLKQHHELHYTCQKTLLQTKFEVLKYLKKLFSLNPKARKLQKKKERAKKNLVKALQTGQPLLIAQANQLLLDITIKQKVFHEKQKFYIHQANKMSQSVTDKLNTAFKLKSKKAPILNFSRSKDTLSIMALPPFSLSPVYKPKPNFTQEQSLIIKWKTNLKNLLTQEIYFLKHLLPKDFTLKGQCGATLIRKDQIWTSTLIKVNAY